jgi:hypothetical protein
MLAFVSRHLLRLHRLKTGAFLNPLVRARVGDTQSNQVSQNLPLTSFWATIDSPSPYTSATWEQYSLLCKEFLGFLGFENGGRRKGGKENEEEEHRAFGKNMETFTCSTHCAIGLSSVLGWFGEFFFFF